MIQFAAARHAAVKFSDYLPLLHEEERENLMELCDGKFTFSDIYNSMVGAHDHHPRCMACCITSISHLSFNYESEYQFKNSRLTGHELDGRVVRNSETRAYSNRYPFKEGSESEIYRARLNKLIDYAVSQMDGRRTAKISIFGKEGYVHPRLAGMIACAAKGVESQTYYCILLHHVIGRLYNRTETCMVNKAMFPISSIRIYFIFQFFGRQKKLDSTSSEKSMSDKDLNE